MPEHLVRRLESLSALTQPQALAIRTLFTGARKAMTGEDIVREGERLNSLSVILDGLACRYKTTPDGRRQIMGFLIAGDLVDVHGYMTGEMDHSVGALTACRVASAPHQKVFSLLEQQPALSHVLWAQTIADGAVMREWLVGLGRRSAYSRIAHLLCEVMARLTAAGRADGTVCGLPLTQQELADSLGLSLVHVNRVLQRLRLDGLVTLGRGSLQVHDWQGLQKAGDFDPAYLNPRATRHYEKSNCISGNYIRP